MNRKIKIIVGIIILLLTVSGIALMKILMNQKTGQVVQTSSKEVKMASEEEIQRIGQKTKVSALSVIGRKTGTVPFDENNEAGYKDENEKEIESNADVILTISTGVEGQVIVGGIIALVTLVGLTIVIKKIKK